MDLRGDKVLGYALQVLGDQAGTELEEPIRKLQAWRDAGAHRRDKEPRDLHYEHRDAIKIMDAWWPRWIEAQFKPALGDELYGRLIRMLDLDDEPNANGSHRGSAYIAGFYGHAEKDLRSILGESPAGAYSRRYCGGGDPAACEQLLRQTLLEAIAEPAAVTYEDELCAEDDTPGFEDPQLCFDAIAHTTAGAVTQPLIHWINRPTFQQAVEIRGLTP